MIFVLDFRSSDEGSGLTAGVLKQLDNAGEEVSGEFAADLLRQASHITFITHGYNVNRKDGREGLLNLASHLPSDDTKAIVAILWPGDKENNIWSTLSFPWQGSNADDTAKALVTFITQRRAIMPGTPLSFITHSLGARVGMEAIARMVGKLYPVEQVCLMAPAIVDSSLASSKEYRSATESCDRIAVLASRMDLVLGGAFPIGNLLEVFPLMGKESVGLALGWHGPVNKGRSNKKEKIPENVLHKQISWTRNAGHSDYIPDFSYGEYQNNGASSSQRNRRSAMSYAADVMSNRADPKYP